MEQIVADLNTLTADREKQAEAFKDFPDDPEKAADFYKLPQDMLPEGVTLPEGVQFEANQELLNRALPVLHKHRVSPETFQDLTRAFNAYELENYQKATAEFADDAKKLGENGAARRKAINEALPALVGPDLAKIIDANTLMSGGVQFFEALIKRFSDQGSGLPGDSRRDAPPPPPLETMEQRWYRNAERRAS